jgi:hypothetical protein
MAVHQMQRHLQELRIPVVVAVAALISLELVAVAALA